jgi:hypothetical protein
MNPTQILNRSKLDLELAPTQKKSQTPNPITSSRAQTLSQHFTETVIPCSLFNPPLRWRTTLQDFDGLIYKIQKSDRVQLTNLIGVLLMFESGGA